MKSKDNNIILIGYRCTGKTAVGKSLSERLKMPFYDTDDLIKQECGRTIADLVAEKGWSFFRQKEREVIGGLAGLRGSVIAPGGGAVADRHNVESLQRNGIFVWLTADLPTILTRMTRDQETAGQRPSLTRLDAINEVAEVLRQRLPVYARLAAFSVNTSKLEIEEVAGRICDVLELEG